MPQQSSVRKIKEAMKSPQYRRPSIFFWTARVEKPSPACLPDTLNTCQEPGLPVERLSIFSDLDAVKAHMLVQHKLGPKLKEGFKPSVHKMLYKIPRTDQGRHYRERQKLILENAPLEK